MELEIKNKNVLTDDFPHVFKLVLELKLDEYDMKDLVVNDGKVVLRQLKRELKDYI